jgi:hypothetical protein
MIFDAPSTGRGVVKSRTVPFHRYFALTCAGLFPLPRDGSSSWVGSQAASSTRPRGVKIFLKIVLDKVAEL